MVHAARRVLHCTLRASRVIAPARGIPRDMVSCATRDPTRRASAARQDGSHRFGPRQRVRARPGLTSAPSKAASARRRHHVSTRARRVNRLAQQVHAGPHEPRCHAGGSAAQRERRRRRARARARDSAAQGAPPPVFCMASVHCRFSGHMMHLAWRAMRLGQLPCAGGLPEHDGRDSARQDEGGERVHAYMCVCARACVRVHACVLECARAPVRAGARARVCVCMCACV
jgi:hypothetical protein